MVKAPILSKYLKEAGIPAAVLMDTNSLAGALEFTENLLSQGIQPIIGSSLNYKIEGQKDFFRLGLIAKTYEGYTNLCKILTKSAIRGQGVPFLTDEDLLETKGLIALSGGFEGVVDFFMNKNDKENAEKYIINFKEKFEDFFIEIQRTKSASSYEDDLMKIAFNLNVPCVGVNPVWYLTEEEHYAHDTLLCIESGSVMIAADRKKSQEGQFLLSPKQAYDLFSDKIELLENTLIIAQKCSCYFPKKNPVLPRFPGLEEGMTEDDLMLKKSNEGFLERKKLGLFAPINVYEERLAFELEVIAKMGFSGYFLIVSDFINWAKSQNIPVGPGRGSGAGSLVAYSLGITDIDPLRFGLLFERFLNPDRVSMPDFDIDFHQGRREEVLHYVQTRYGQSRVGQIGTFNKLQSRAAVQNVGRAMGISFPVVNRYSAMIPSNPAAPITLGTAMTIEPLVTELQNADPSIRSLFDTALKLEGLIKSSSTHAAGVVIADRVISDIAPLMRDPHGNLVLQYDMKSVEKGGLVKFDFLGLKTLDVIDMAFDLAKQSGQSVTEESFYTLDDPETYEMIAKGDTFAVFQLESMGMRNAIRQVAPTRIEDIIALVSLFRPGPLENIPEYARVKNGLAEASYLHSSMESSLSETFGIIVYQEQVMEIARQVAGYTLSQADLLRRAMGKKIKSEMDAQREVFLKGCQANNVDAKIATEIFDLLAKFADYGFNKSHAAAYAVLSYQTAWLKRHRPAAFFAASMNLDLGQVDKLAEFIPQAQSDGLKILPPDVRYSQARFSVEKTKNGLAVRYGLSACRGVGLEAASRLIEIRSKNRFTDYNDFCSKAISAGLNKKAIESLAKAGALDALSTHRGEAFYGVADGIENAHGQRGGQESLLSLIGMNQQSRDYPDMTETERLEGELWSLGFFMSGHPLDKLHSLKTPYKLLTNVLKGDEKNNQIAVRIMDTIFKNSRSQKPMAIIKVSDPSLIIELILFGDDVSLYKPFIEKGNIVQMHVETSVRDGEKRLWIKDIKNLDVELMERSKKKV